MANVQCIDSQQCCAVDPGPLPMDPIPLQQPPDVLAQPESIQCQRAIQGIGDRWVYRTVG